MTLSGYKLQHLLAGRLVGLLAQQTLLINNPFIVLLKINNKELSSILLKNTILAQIKLNNYY